MCRSEFTSTSFRCMTWTDRSAGWLSQGRIFGKLGATHLTSIPSCAAASKQRTTGRLGAGIRSGVAKVHRWIERERWPSERTTALVEQPPIRHRTVMLIVQSVLQ